ncbi:MAG: hypothetical protein K0Q59_5289, partial [Paenibacillus sp.]|nr:hypothetical protein [Paenibacillus sp.]
WAVGIWWIGMVGYFFTSLLYPFFRNTEPYTTWINLFGIVTLAITLYQTNRSTLAKESLESGALKLTRIGKETLFRNRALLITLFTIIVAIAALPFLIYAAKQVWSAFIALLKWLASSFTTDDFDRPLEEMGDSYLQPSEPSLFALIMQKVIVVVAIIVIVALAALLIYALYKLIRRWLKRFLGWYGERLEKDPKEGYVDEKEKLLESKEWVGEAFNRVKQRIAGWLHKEPGWDELADNRERVRHAYRRLLLGRIARGYSFDAALTPRETGGEMGRRAPLEADESATIPLYEDVRYGDREPTDEQAAAVKPLFRGDGGRR